MGPGGLPSPPPAQPRAGGRRRPTGVLLLGVAAVIMVGASLGGEGGAPRPRDDLARRLETAPEPARFGFSYRRGGTRVLDCVLADTSYAAEVDLARERMVVRPAGPGGDATILAAPEGLFLHRSLFAEPPFATAWLRTPRPADEATAATLRRLIGADLARDVAGARLPPSGEAVVAEAVAVAAGVERTATATVGGAPAEGFRIDVDPARFRAAAKAPPGAEDELIPVFDVWVDRNGSVVRVAVSGRRGDGSPAPPEEGWAVEYRPLADVPFPSLGPSEVTDYAAVDAGRLARPPRECRLPS